MRTKEPLRELIRAALGNGYRFLETRRRPRGVDLARMLGPDLVVLDVMMPGTSGLEVLASLRDGVETGTIPVVVLTAWTHAQQEALEAQARSASSRSRSIRTS